MNAQTVGHAQSNEDDDRGEHKILLLGMRRAHIKRELTTEQAYRTAEVALVDDQYPPKTAPCRDHLHQALMGHFEQLLPVTDGSISQLHEMVQSNIPLGILSDVISFSVAPQNRISGRKSTRQVIQLSNDQMSPLFLAAVEATEEAIYNSLFRATTVTGRDGHIAEAIPLQKTAEILQRHRALASPAETD